MARLVEEDVHDEVAVVEQHPAQIVEPLGPQRLRSARRRDLAFDLLGDRAHLAGVRSARDDEVIGDREDVTDREHDGIDRLLG